MNRRIGWACLTTLMIFAATQSFAQGTDPQAACQADAGRLCASAGTDQKRIAACLRKNKKSLSPECKAVMGAKKGKAGKRA